MKFGADLSNELMLLLALEKLVQLAEGNCNALELRFTVEFLQARVEKVLPFARKDPYYSRLFEPLAGMKPCDCLETYPQLVPGKVSHGPGCNQTDLPE